MAKGLPPATYNPQAFTGDVGPELTHWVYQELSRISAVLELALVRNVEFLNVAPSKPREGMVTGADGTNWNPGGGKGVYAYYTGAWHLLG